MNVARAAAEVKLGRTLSECFRYQARLSDGRFLVSAVIRDKSVPSGAFNVLWKRANAAGVTLVQGGDPICQLAVASHGVARDLASLWATAPVARSAAFAAWSRCVDCTARGVSTAVRADAIEALRAAQDAQPPRLLRFVLDSPEPTMTDERTQI